MNEIRCFIAIEIPESIRIKIFRVGQTFQNIQKGEIRWVRPANIHMTLRFLGNMGPNELAEMKQILTLAAKRYNPFSISIQGTGTFPNDHRPRIIWVGSVPDPVLFELQRDIEKELTKAGYKPENHPFRPHITIGRVSENLRRERVPQIIDHLSRWQNEVFGNFSVSRIQLFRSDLRQTGPIYSSLFTVNLEPLDD